ncbi:DUF2149 domain-containing protein [Blastopirellula marina]|uniref:DUF2149 domain-containing protein n=1 Tax=Blastopirellula marina DSM 3645 TaxID=314230 RepID=A3ZMX0_9BACT|nr:DUF2149 domain-containing protein [Blastopirellula marina]EAQ82299.1 hypothetical protein DSM3645_01255 [Blastopirellula marina DSM 3645]
MSKKLGGRRVGRHRKLLTGGEEDPLDGVANLFDVAMVFAVAMLLAVIARLPFAASTSGANSASQTSNSKMDSIENQDAKLERFEISDQMLGGEGERLGAAYRLPSGEVICVPDR